MTLLLIIILGPIIGGLYGILHDQLTYTISPEYYTKFKFYQFGLVDAGNEALVPNPRLYVSVVGFLATWWMGVPIGIVLGLVGLIHPGSRQMLIVTLQAMGITVLVAFVTGLIGLVYGKLYLAGSDVDWWLPDNLIRKKDFIAVGSMHNFSYFGGLTGLIAGIVYSVWRKNRLATARVVAVKLPIVLLFLLCIGCGELPQEEVRRSFYFPIIFLRWDSPQ